MCAAQQRMTSEGSGVMFPILPATDAARDFRQPQKPCGLERALSVWRVTVGREAAASLSRMQDASLSGETHSWMEPGNFFAIFFPLVRTLRQPGMRINDTRSCHK